MITKVMTRFNKLFIKAVLSPKISKFGLIINFDDKKHKIEDLMKDFQNISHFI